MKGLLVEQAERVLQARRVHGAHAGIKGRRVGQGLQGKRVLVVVEELLVRQAEQGI